MKKLLSIFTVCVVIAVALTACSSDDNGNDDKKDNTGGNAASIETLMNTAPSQTGWSGAIDNGVLYYRPTTSANSPKLNNIVRSIKSLTNITRATDDDYDYDIDDDDDDDDGIDATVFYSFYIENGILGKIYTSRVCLIFRSETIAKEAENAFKNMSIDDDDDDDTMYNELVRSYFQKNVKRSGKTIYFLLSGLPAMPVSELKNVMEYWMWAYSDESSSDEKNYENVSQTYLDKINKVYFGTIDEDNLTYTGNQTNENSVAGIMGIQKMNMTSSHGTYSDGNTWWRVNISMNFKSEQQARLYYQNNSDTEGIGISGATVMAASSGDPYDRNTVRRSIIYADLIFNAPYIISLIAQN